MGRKYFKKKGFGGLTKKSKAIYIGIVIGVGLIGWLILYLSVDAVNDVPPLGFVGGLLIGVLAAEIAEKFLPRDSYYYTEYFCADCGQFLGYSSSICNRCGCNRWTTSDPGVGRTFRIR